MRRVVLPLGSAVLFGLLALGCYLAVDAERRGRLARPDVIHFPNPVWQYGGYLVFLFCALAFLLTLYAVVQLVIEVRQHLRARRDR